jgi:hypothetical protein
MRTNQARLRIEFWAALVVGAALVAVILLAGLPAPVPAADTPGDFKARVAAVCATGSPARLDLTDMATICREAQQ